MVGLPPERMVWRASLAFLNQRAAETMRRGLLVVRTERCVAVRFNLPHAQMPAQRFGLYPSVSLTTLVSLPAARERRTVSATAEWAQKTPATVIHRHQTFASSLRFGTRSGHPQAQDSPSAIATAANHMSYETAQKVEQQQLKDRVVYAGILLLGFAALYINLKRAANEHEAWEKDHS